MMDEIIRITVIMTEIDRAKRRIAEWTNGPLDLSHLLLYKLPPIPTSITQLYCTGCHLTELSISNHLTFINCSYNPLRTLPELPRGLRALTCDHAELTQLPTLPDTLQRLVCRTNPLEYLPELPHGLIELLCSETPIESLPTLPKTLEVLKCENNRLQSLPSLPDNLKKLVCSNNLLTDLPSLPEHLKELDCRFNPISNLPDIHSSMSYLLCNDDNEWARGPKENMYEHMDRVKLLTSQRRTNKRCSMVKEGIMMKAWHPSRVERLILAGIDVEDM
jgi:Leucine-rich repeat (LRR) protein